MKKAVIGTVILIIAVILFSFDACALALHVETLNTSWMRIIYIPVYSLYLYVLAYDSIERQKRCACSRINERKKEVRKAFMEEYNKFYHEVHEKGLNHYGE